MALEIGGGIDIGGGVNLGPFPVSSFTITPSDLTFNSLIYTGYSSYDSNGFTSNGTQLYNGIDYTISSTLHDAIVAAMTAAGMSNTSAYAWRVTWANGDQSIVRVGLDPTASNTIGLAPINQADTRWQTGDNLNGPTQVGTFQFPAVFTPYYPLTTMSGNNSWC